MSLSDHYRAVVIGGGPGGYVAAIRLGQLGVKTLLVERDLLGGECLNRGCIPSKILISGVNRYWLAKSSDWIEKKDLSMNWGRLQAWRERTLNRLRLGIKYLLEGNGVGVVEGEASLAPGNIVRVRLRDGSEKRFRADNIIIATGGEHASIPAIPTDGRRVVTSSQALELPEIPRRLLIVGGGVSGLEIGTVYAKLGTQVTIVEVMDQILPGFEIDLVEVVERRLRRLGVKIHTRSRVVESRVWEDRVKAWIESEGGGSIEVEADYAMVAVGKKAATRGLGLEEVGVKLDDRGFIIVNERLETDVSGVYAVGDVTGPPFLAHRASYHGMVAAENIAGEGVAVDESAIPSAVFTDPEIACAGLTASEAERRGMRVRVGKFPFSALGRAVLEGEVDGFVRIVADESTGRIVGCQMVGPHVSELISEAVVAIRSKLTAREFARSIRPHPTFSEAISEAAEAVFGRPIHILVK